MTSARQTLGVGVIGLGWMGEAHARAYLRAPRHFPADNLEVRLVACADNVARRAEATARRYGFAEHSTDWRAVVAHREVDLVSITAPNHLHLEIVEAAAAAGKHIFCEKPVGRFLAETAAAAAAARAAGVVTGVGYNYRWAPLVQHCGRLIRAGALGGIRHFHGRFFTMYGSHPLSRLTWRFDREVSGHGAAGDILAHVIDTALFLAGPIKRVVGRQQTDIAQRPLPAPGRGTHFSLGGAGDRKGAVTNEDYVGALLEFAGGGGGTVEASRTVPGPKCEFAFEIYGEKGALRWDFER
ncbi:MAG: Gfo/Idh/MocA family oxidoreductase, partial [Gammaproteobacteria bacterium]|nr:Gfo/Idh/MocA family oxidoreductase [Gammaproteobacteria bacterium]